ncbi:hypothetical protein [Brevundimonas sp. UBA7664]|uniref:hypothetical protein n=1 Tax=Brevundimonas sp. UBA7664 TaxID=1946141 RepID=UPI0025C04B7C|nr:hypothetical protein [Brevundimonas sp. UBA7664]
MTAVPIDGGFRHREPFHRRTFAPVRRNSRPAGRENWRALTKGQANRQLLALEMYREKLRQPGQRWGARGTISAGAIGFYKLMCNIAVRYRGKLDHPVSWFAYKLNVPEKVIHAWKRQLKEHGFLDWRRRYIETGREGIRGPQVEQTTNAYWLSAPKEALQAAEKVMPPPPDDIPHEAADPALQEALDRLGNRIADNMAKRDRFRSD